MTTYEYDTADRLTQTTDAAGNVTTLTLNQAGQPTTTMTAEVSPTGTANIIETAAYDAPGRLATAADGLGNTTRFTWDARSRRVRMTDPESYVTTWSYDGLDRQIEELRPEGIRVTTGWDLASRRTSYTDAAGSQTTWSHDALDRTTGVTYPDATSFTYGYDAAGNRTALTDANGTVITQTFDDANRRTAVSVVPGPDVIGPTAESYSYDALNRLTGATSGSGPSAITTSYTYDSLSRPLTETTLGKTVTTSYDAVGNATQLTYPSGLAVPRAFDPLDRLERVGSVASPYATYTFQGAYRVAGQTLGVALVGNTDYDASRRPLSRTLALSSGQRAYAETLAWNPRSLKSARTRGDLNGAGSFFEYDKAQRLTSEGLSHVPAELSTALKKRGISAADRAFGRASLRT